MTIHARGPRISFVPHQSTLRLRIIASILVMQAAGVAASPAAFAPDWQSRITPRLLTIWRSGQPARSGASQPSTIPASGARPSSSAARFDAKGRLQIDVEFDCASAAPGAGLIAAGMVIGTTLKVPPLCVVEGWAGTAALPGLASLAAVKGMDLPHYSQPRTPITAMGKPQARSIPQAADGTPAIDGNGVSIMNADKYVAQTGIDGAGVTVAVINGGAASLALIEGRGELPQVQVVQPSANSTPPANPGDEGTMMLEEVHAVAPGAQLAFCGPQTYVEYVACVQNLIAAQATVITDDLLFPGYDLMSAPAHNIATQAVASLISGNPNVLLFSAAGNNAGNYWQGPYTPFSGTGNTKTCQGQTDNFFQIYGNTQVNTWQSGGSTASDLELAWTNTDGVSSANYDLYVEDTSGNVIACAAGSGSTEISGSTTADVIAGSALTSPNIYYIVIGTPDESLSGNFLKLLGFGDGADSWSSTSPGSTSSPQDFAAGVFTTGAVDGGDGIGNAIEPFSATGPIQFEVPSPSTLQSPTLVAPDDVYVDAAGTEFQVSSTGTFYGTSAASPNTAAVAALLKSAFPTLTAAQTIGVLESGAAQLGGSAPNGTYGYGRVDAIGALAQVAAPTISTIANLTVVGGTSSAPLLFTVGGTGNLTIKTSSSVTSLISSAPPGTVLSPATCGVSSLNCTVTITPTLGQVGSAAITVSSTDGAARSKSAGFTVTVTKPAPPSVNVTAGATQSFTQGGSATPVTFTVAGTQALSVRAVSSNAALLPASGVTLTSGCGGKTQLSCTVTLAVASGQSGTSTVTITATDPYAQVGTGTATITVNAPASGGGSLNAVWLAALAALAGLQVRRRRKHSHRRLGLSLI